MDEIEVKIAAEVASEIFKGVMSGARRLIGLATEYDRTWDILGRQAEKYARGMLERHGMMRIFGMSKPVPLRGIYTQVNILESISLRRRLDIEDLQSDFEKSWQEEFEGKGQVRFGRVETTKSGLSAVNEFDRFILLGKPGSGKTTFLKYIVLQGLNGGLSSRRLPIFVSLHQVSISGKSLLESILYEFEVCGISDAALFVNNLLENGKFILLLDGLDEVIDERKPSIIREIIDLSDRFEDNQFVVSCRIAAYSYWFEKFIDVEVADFGVDQIKVFTNNWFREDGRKGSLCLEAILEKPSLAEMASTPLLLTMMCLAFDENLDLSSNRAELYKDSIDALLKKWDVTRTIRRDEVYKKLTLKRKEDLFSFVAASTFVRKEFFLTRARCEALIREYIGNIGFDSGATLDDDARIVLDTVAAQHGLLVERAKGIFSFSHLTFHEYFAARYFVNTGHGAISNMAAEHLSDPQWREVIVIASSLMSEADDFIVALLDKLVKEFGFSGRYLWPLRLSLDRARAAMLQSKSANSLLGIDPATRPRPMLHVVQEERAPTVDSATREISLYKYTLYQSIMPKLARGTLSFFGRPHLWRFPDDYVEVDEKAFEAPTDLGTSANMTDGAQAAQSDDTTAAGKEFDMEDENDDHDNNDGDGDGDYELLSYDDLTRTNEINLANVFEAEETPQESKRIAETEITSDSMSPSRPDQDRKRLKKMIMIRRSRRFFSELGKKLTATEQTFDLDTSQSSEIIENAKENLSDNVKPLRKGDQSGVGQDTLFFSPSTKSELLDIVSSAFLAVFNRPPCFVTDASRKRLLYLLDEYLVKSISSEVAFEMQLITAAETVVDVIVQPIYIRRETREAALRTVVAFGRPSPLNNPPPVSKRA